MAVSGGRFRRVVQRSGRTDGLRYANGISAGDRSRLPAPAIPIPRADKPNEIWLDLALPLVLTVSLGGLVLFISKPGLGHVLRLDDSGSWLGLMIIVFISCFIGFILYLFCERPIRFGLGIGGVILASFLWASGQNQTLYSERNFFGVLEVVHDAAEVTIASSWNDDPWSPEFKSHAPS